MRPGHLERRGPRGVPRHPVIEDASVTETLAKEAERHQADILVVGATGLKIEQGAVHADSRRHGFRLRRCASVASLAPRLDNG